MGPDGLYRAMRWLGLRPTAADAFAFLTHLDDDADGYLAYRDFERGVAEVAEGEDALKLELAKPIAEDEVDDKVRAELQELEDRARIDRVKNEEKLAELAKPLGGDDDNDDGDSDAEDEEKQNEPNPIVTASVVYFDFARPIARGGGQIKHVTRCGPTEVLVDSEAAKEIKAIPDDLDGDGDGDGDGDDADADDKTKDKDGGDDSESSSESLDLFGDSQPTRRGAKAFSFGKRARGGRAPRGRARARGRGGLFGAKRRNAFGGGGGLFGGPPAPPPPPGADDETPLSMPPTEAPQMMKLHPGGYLRADIPLPPVDDTQRIPVWSMTTCFKVY